MSILKNTTGRVDGSRSDLSNMSTMNMIHTINDFLFEPHDCVSMTLIAVNLIQNGSLDAARKYLDRAFDVNPAYPNIYNGFALLAETEHNFKEMFEMSIVLLFKNPKKDLLYQQSLNTGQSSYICKTVFLSLKSPVPGSSPRRNRAKISIWP